MIVLSLFDGVSCSRLALERAGIPVEAYYASEIDKYAIALTKTNRPDTIHLGDVKNVRVRDCEHESLHSSCIQRGTEIGLLIGGSPCQDLSIAGKNRKGLDGDRSGLFWEYVRILSEVKPKYFVLENVASMPKEAKQTITEALGVEPIMINAALVSAQNRKRLFWVGKRNEVGIYTRVYIDQPEDREIYLQDILEKDIAPAMKSYAIDANYNKGFNFGSNGGTPSFEKGKRQHVQIGNIGTNAQAHRIYSSDGKSVSLTSQGGGQGAKTGLYKIQDTVRMLTPVECERLQGMPDGWTQWESYETKDREEKGFKVISNSQRYKMCGNAFNVDVVAHILSFIK